MWKEGRKEEDNPCGLSITDSGFYVCVSLEILIHSRPFTFFSPWNPLFGFEFSESLFGLWICCLLCRFYFAWNVPHVLQSSSADWLPFVWDPPRTTPVVTRVIIPQFQWQLPVSETRSTVLRCHILLELTLWVEILLWCVLAAGCTAGYTLVYWCTLGCMCLSSVVFLGYI